VLHVLNRELGADFEPDAFEHVARWNGDDQRIEMWLRTAETQDIHVADLDLDLSFRSGEEMLTEISSKFTAEGLESELRHCGFVIEEAWRSAGDEFQLSLIRPSR
jgi:L-histidine N-alpha-methyltransferase